MKKIILSLLMLGVLCSSAIAQSALEEYKTRQVTNPAEQDKNGTDTVTAPSAIPSGAVMAFDLGGKCPAGWYVWKPAEGRVIVGSGTLEGKKYQNRDLGGNAGITMTPNNITKGRTTISGLALKIQEDKTAPYVMVADTSVVEEECIDREKHCTRYPPRPYTIDLGLDNPTPADNRQPYVALTYCKKI